MFLLSNDLKYELMWLSDSVSVCGLEDCGFESDYAREFRSRCWQQLPGEPRDRLVLTKTKEQEQNPIPQRKRY